MKIEKLIEKLNELQKTHPNINVNLFDWRKNFGDDDEGSSSVGVYDNFDIEVIKLEGEEAKYYQEQNDKPFIAWIAVSFENEDYNEDGILINN